MGIGDWGLGIGDWGLGSGDCVVDDRLEDLVLRVVVGDAGVGHALQADLGRQLENVRSVRHKYSLPLSDVRILVSYRISLILSYPQHCFNTMMDFCVIFCARLVFRRKLFYYER